MYTSVRTSNGITHEQSSNPIGWLFRKALADLLSEFNVLNLEKICAEHRHFFHVEYGPFVDTHTTLYVLIGTFYTPSFYREYLPNSLMWEEFCCNYEFWNLQGHQENNQRCVSGQTPCQGQREGAGRALEKDVKGNRERTDRQTRYGRETSERLHLNHLITAGKHMVKSRCDGPLSTRPPLNIIIENRQANILEMTES